MVAEEIKGNFDTGVITLVVHKPALLICGIVAIICGFLGKDAIRSVTINVMLMFIIYGICSKNYVTLLILGSGILWSFTNRDYYPGRFGEFTEKIAHIIILSCYAAFVSFCFIHGTGYYEYLSSNVDKFNNTHNLPNGLLALTGPWLICVIIALVQDLLYAKSKLYCCGDPLYFIRKRIPFLLHKTFIVLRIISLIVSVVLLVMNFDKKHYITLAFVIVTVCAMVDYAVYQMKKGTNEGWIIIPNYFLKDRNQEYVWKMFSRNPSRDTVMARVNHKSSKKDFERWMVEQGE